MKSEVTIYCLTYNHAAFIRDALDGFLMQKTTYPYKIFVYDDASTDGTSEILREYKERYPDMFDLYINEENVYHDSNRYFFYENMYREHIKGKYVAWCEGDDCWTDPNKLQMQVDYLERHPECSMVAHAAQWVDCRTNQIKEYHPYKENRYLSAEEVILHYSGNLTSASLVMKRDVLVKDEAFPPCDVGDIPVQLNALCKGKIFYMDKVMSKYRYMHAGSWSSNFWGDLKIAWEHKLNLADFYVKYDAYSQYRFHEFIQEMKKNCLYLPIWRCEQFEIEEVKMIARSINERSNGRFQNWITIQMDMIYMQRENDYLSASLKACVQEKRYVVIMGTGHNAKDMTLRLRQARIHLNGYVISNDQNLPSGKQRYPVWKLSQYPYSWKETALVVAVGEQFQKEIENNLKKEGIEDFETPYWLKV